MTERARNGMGCVPGTPAGRSSICGLLWSRLAVVHADGLSCNRIDVQGYSDFQVQSSLSGCHADSFVRAMLLAFPPW